jgi:hypothetical protein
MTARNFKVVGDGIGEAGNGIPRYPVPSSVRLDSHYFVLWNIRRWRGSDTRRAGYKDPEVGFFARELFDLAHDETPVGTLPRDDAALAFLLRMSLDAWQTLRKREINPLTGWYEVECDNGETRFAHRVVTEVVLEAVDSKQRNQVKNADDRMRKRLGTIAGHVRALPGASGLADQEDRLTDISDWIDREYGGGSATQKRVREAIEALYRR